MSAPRRARCYSRVVRRTLVAALLACFGLAAAPACTRQGGDDLRGEVAYLVSQEGEQAQAAATHLSGFGRRALPSIEAALHTADAHGRKNLILALRKLGDIESVPLLRHLALHDDDDGVKQEAEWTLRGWSRAGDARADRARAALREIDERRGHEASG